MNYFNADLEYSENIRNQEDFNKFYYKKWPVKSIEYMNFSSHRHEQRSGIDKKIHLDNGKVITTEEKVRRVDYGDIFLEIVSNTKTGARGWIYTCQSEYLLYFIEPTRKAFLLPVELLKLAYKNNIEEWSKKYKILTVPNKGYCSKGIGIPVNVLMAAMSKEISNTY